jgi:hypothetical protein
MNTSKDFCPQIPQIRKARAVGLKEGDAGDFSS